MGPQFKMFGGRYDRDTGVEAHRASSPRLWSMGSHGKPWSEREGHEQRVGGRSRVFLLGCCNAGCSRYYCKNDLYVVLHTTRVAFPAACDIGVRTPPVRVVLVVASSCKFKLLFLCLYSRQHYTCSAELCRFKTYRVRCDCTFVARSIYSMEASTFSLPPPPSPPPSGMINFRVSRSPSKASAAKQHTALLYSRQSVELGLALVNIHNSLRQLMDSVTL